MKFKRILSIILTLMTILSTFAIFGSFSASAETGYDRGYKQTMAGTGKVVAKGLDISEHQAGINLQKIKDAGFDYVIIRAGVKLNAGSNRKDYNFEDFYAQARKVGLDVGTYYYSQAKNVNEAKEEAKCFLEYIKGKIFEYPVYLDFESGTVRDYLNKDSTRATEICYAFMDTMRDAGYLVGLYGYAGWFDDGYGGWMASKLNNDIGKKYEFWMANYYNNSPDNTKSTKYPTKYGMYQYSSDLTINGWSGRLDHNVCYKDYPAIVKQYGFNGYEAGGAVATEKPTEAETVAVNKYAISSDIKKVKEHIGSEITSYLLDGKKVDKADSYDLEAGQKLRINGFAGFTEAIKEFGYYFDGDDSSAVWSKGSAASATTKKKAGDKAKNFDIDADTTALTPGEHTLTYAVKLASKEVELITVTLNVSGGNNGSVGESNLASDTAAASDSGCKSTVGVGATLIALATVGGAAIVIKKKKED